MADLLLAHGYFLVEDEKCARMFVVEKDVATPVRRDDVEVVSGWPVVMLWD